MIDNPTFLESADGTPHIFVLMAVKDLIHGTVSSFCCWVFKICLAGDISVHLSNNGLDWSMKWIFSRFSQFLALLSVLLTVNMTKIVIDVGNSISKLQIQVATYVFELSAGNCHH